MNTNKTLVGLILLGFGLGATPSGIDSNGNIITATLPAYNAIYNMVTAGSLNIVSANGVYNSIVSQTISVAGTYRIWCQVRGTIQVSSGVPAYFTYQFRDTTNGLDYPSSNRFGSYTPQINFPNIVTTHLEMYIVNAGASTTYTLMAARNSGGTYLNSSIDGGNNTTCGFERLGGY